jgi:hypothetical protein
MVNTLTQSIKANEPELRRLVDVSLRFAGILIAAVIVFVILYFFVASLEVPRRAHYLETKKFRMGRTAKYEYTKEVPCPPQPLRQVPSHSTT